jgi:hypothetical protein
MKFSVLHISDNLQKEQKQLIDWVNEIVGVRKNFDDIFEPITSMCSGYTATIKERTPLGQQPPFEFTSSIFPVDKEIYIAGNPKEEDFYIIKCQ